MAQILLAGLDREIASDFSGKLNQLGFPSQTAAFDLNTADAAAADVIFASGDDVRCLGLLNRVRSQAPSKPFIIVGRVAEEERWLEALEAGATDYCTSEISLDNLGWILTNALNLRAMTCAA